MDKVFANAIASGAEASLLERERFDRMIECSDVKEVLKIAAECGFGGDERDWQAAASDEERKLCAFIRDYAASPRLSAYLLAERDFANAQAVVKAKFLNESPERMLGAEGRFTATELSAAADGGDAELPEILIDAIKTATELLQNGEDGFAVDVLFSRALFAYRKTIVPAALKRYERMRADAKNILTAMRAPKWADAVKMLVSGGTLEYEILRELCEGARETAYAMFALTDYADFAAAVAAAAAEKRPYVDAERMIDGFALSALKNKRFQPSGDLPFVLYCLDRENEIKNFRVIAAGVAGNAEKSAIRARLRETYES